MDHFLSSLISAPLLIPCSLNFRSVGQSLIPILGLEKVFSCVIFFTYEASLLTEGGDWGVRLVFLLNSLVIPVFLRSDLGR